MDNKKANKLFDEGYAYETGNGISQDIDKAIEKYLEAGENGHADAICRAGYCYQFFKGNIKMAIELYCESIDAGSSNGKFLLGNCYYDGKGVEQNTEKGCILRNEAIKEESSLALRWFAKITKQF